MKRIYLAAALAASALTATSASAATPVNFTLTTDLSGNFAGVQNFDGVSTLTGSFDFDLINTGAAVTNFMAPFTQNGQSGTQNFMLSGITAKYDGTNLIFSQNSTTVFNFAITDLTLGANNGPPADANTTTLASSFLYDGLTVNINAGSTGRINAAVPVTSPVPEPATWAMMLLGFGMIGATARYRRRHSKVTYA